MSGKLNEPRFMSNCVRCYYATRKRKDGSCVCARYPKWVDVYDMDEHFCGEFVWIDARDERLRGDAE